ncbi:PREDICTED: tigger transposable element-derived protein 4-like [Trachymyrmex septentrionalis]|uniref:tigger transposable element-derived protein 4-like n=1 Tax=Trachymyrmex septentrionalis TaxID=34720 RepID=UPI00084F3E7F|nr:PREDICTED: tigger transposable element-derived protein 4-like [Trachymyrmex septentrionalis]
MKVIKDDLLRWTCERHATGCLLDRHLLRDKALELAHKHGLTNFKCTEKWLTSFLKKYGFSLRNTKELSGPIFNNYRLWIDMMRSIITQYKHKDLFHADELMMYSDVPPTEISASKIQQDESNTNLEKMTILLCCNASGTEKLPLLICGSYLAVVMGKDYIYSHSKDTSINDSLFREWLIQLNCLMSNDDRRILLLLHRNRIDAFRDLELSNIKHIFFPDDFPPMLRPLKRDVFHFVKMTYRRKYVEGIRERRHQWNVENVVRSLMEAWRQVPRNLIIASFQRTSFRTDDCLLEIRYDAWEDLKTGISFRKFVTFDDYLTANASQNQCESTSRNHSYNLRTRMSKETDKFNNLFNFATSSKEKDPIFDHALVNEISKITYEKKDIDWKRTNPLKRSHDKAQLNEELYEEAKLSNESTSRENENIAIIPTLERPPKVVDIQIESIARTSKSSDIYLTTQASVNESRTNTEYDKSECDKTVNNEERCKNSRVSSNERSIKYAEVDNVNDDDIASQQVFNDTSAVDSQLDTKEPNAKVVSFSFLRDEVEEADLDGNVRSSSRKSLKRRSVDKSEGNSSDEPERKRLRSDSDWMKQYETTFVFGPFDVARTVTTVSADTFTISDSGVPQLKPRRSCETERSIFTISPRRD